MSITQDQRALAGRITGLLMPWYRYNQRVFPFRGTKDPYRIWISEIMLQQTRTGTVGAYYERFLAAFPDVFALAKASEESVLKAWEGLGYYTRARNLHKTARLVANDMNGVFPSTERQLQALPGIGPYAAAAIASIAYDEPVPAMDGNLNRVISRLFLIQEEITRPVVKQLLHSLGCALMPPSGAGDMNQALMDLGATICVPGTPDCGACPVITECLAHCHIDPAGLPVMKQKKPPLEIPVAVSLVTLKDRLLVFRRREALLKGLYVFLLTEGDSTAGGAEAACRRMLGKPFPAEPLGEARHVFTHRIWQMRLYHHRAEKFADVPGGEWVSLEELLALPLPVAMNRAKEEAIRLLGKDAILE